MKVLLTSGGTRTPIDEVRHVGNMSSGTFGRHLCIAFMRAGLDVTFLYARGSKCPHELRLDLSGLLPGGAAYESDDGLALVSERADLKVQNSIRLLSGCMGRYHPVEYADFEDYAAKLFQLIGKVRPDIVVLAAAVSDYAPVKREGKISSELDEMTIRLEKTPKLIRKVKDLLPECFLVGFKLLVGSTQSQLEEAMAGQMAKARCDMVVGNDLRDIRAGQHKLTTVSIDHHTYEHGPASGAELAEGLVKEIILDAGTMNGKFVHLGASGRSEVKDGK